jgi:hypothetical protein
MFEQAHLLGLTESKIEVQTRKGRSLKNNIALEPGEKERRIYDSLRRKFGDRWQERKPPCGVYNCAGHVWASRRTSIYEDNEWHVVLSDDGYRKLDPTESPLAGDLVVYRDGQVGFLHVGLILEMRELALGSQKTPWVLSKWDDASWEVIHHYRHYPWEGFSVEIEFWTDRLQAAMRKTS